MKKLLLILALFVLTANANVISSCSNVSEDQTSVYICDSKSSIVYHTSETCAGLKHCSHQTLTISKEDAINKYHRRACKKCY